VARTIANSPLVKTAVHGADPNWGRIVAAAGRSGGRFDVARTRCTSAAFCCSRTACRTTTPRPKPAAHAGHGRSHRGRPGHGGGGTATIWTVDLSAEYVRINGEYRT
jgi:glutamate N-acetyltransferase/amino-acid N-acetyltransferase